MKETKDTIQFYIYPDGVADSLGQDAFVLVRNTLGSLDTKFVGDLINGDYYCERIPKPLPPRNAEDILRFISDMKLSINYLWTEDEDPICKAIEVHLDGDILMCMDYSEDCLRKAIEPLMDMEEL